MHPIERAYDAVRNAIGPSRQLDAIVASTLSSDMLWNGAPLKSRHLSMAFTRSMENAERFVIITFPGSDWKTSSDRSNGAYHAEIWLRSSVGAKATAKTPALALLAAALLIGKSKHGFSAIRETTNTGCNGATDV